MPGKGTTDAIFIMVTRTRETQIKEEEAIIMLFWIWKRNFMSPKRGGEMGFEEAGGG